MIGRRQTALDQVTELLEGQYKALLNGDLRTLGTMAPDLEKAFARLRRDGADASQIKQLLGFAARNARLLKSAQAGVTQARATLKAVRSPELTTYDAKGYSKAGISAPSRTLSRP